MRILRRIGPLILLLLLLAWALLRLDLRAFGQSLGRSHISLWVLAALVNVAIRAGARAERTRVALHRRVRAICERLHVEYIGQDEPYETAADRGLFLGDLVHGTAAMHRQRGEEEGKALAAAWLRER